MASMEQPSPRLIAYIRAGASYEPCKEQAVAMHAYCAGQGLEIGSTVIDRSGPLGDRPSPRLLETLDLLGEGDGLIAAELRLLASGAANLEELARRLDGLAGYLVAVAEGIDTGTHGGKRSFELFRRGSRWESSGADALLQDTRRHASQAERRARLEGRREGERLAVERAVREHRAKIRAGQARARANGLAVRRRSLADVPELESRIHALLGQGVSRSEVARILNAEGVPPVRGGRRWWPASVPGLQTLDERRARTAALPP